MDPRRVWLCHPAAWRRIRPWPRPSGQIQGGVGGRLQAGRASCWYGAWCCAATHNGCRLVLLPPGIPAGGYLGACHLRWTSHLGRVVVQWGLAWKVKWPNGAGGCFCSRWAVRSMIIDPHQMIGICTSATTKRHKRSRRSPRFRFCEVHRYVGMVVPWTRTDCSLCAPCALLGAYVGRRTSRTQCLLSSTVLSRGLLWRGGRSWLYRR